MPTMIEIEVNGVKELLGDLNQFPEKLQGKVMLGLSQKAYDEAQRGAGRHVVTGALFQSLYNRKIADGRQVGHDPGRAPHAAFVQFGTRPHTIAPKTKKALRWAGPNGFIFAKIVNHPGYIGDPYMIKAKDSALSIFQSIIDKAMKESI